jgi:hypothetical protein
MISSEVQRTLVKSPPELWAELSDPESLARHLGELGEIRITRTEPENLVEWEGDGATGTVALKASGWGTKVTLSASRELIAEEPPATTPNAAPAISADAAPAISAEAAPAASMSVPSVPVAITAAERFAPDYPPTLRGELSQAADSEPAQNTELAPATDTAPTSALDTEPHAALASQPILARETASALESEPDVRAEPISEFPRMGALSIAVQPRRPGFFARLFGRSRRTESPASEQQTTAVEPAHEAYEDSPEESAASAQAPAPIEKPLPPPLTPLRRTLVEAADEPPTPAFETEPAAASGETPAPEVTQPAGESATPATTDQQAGAGADRGAEPEAAEDLAVGEEEMTAVLTGVLDRLGAAHHRPFSRS